MSKCSSSIRRRDSNPRPFKHESSPITTRPGLTPTSYDCFQSILETTELRANHNNNRGNSESGSPYMYIRMDITFANQVNKVLTKEGCLNGLVYLLGKVHVKVFDVIDCSIPGGGKIQLMGIESS